MWKRDCPTGIFFDRVQTAFWGICGMKQTAQLRNQLNTSWWKPWKVNLIIANASWGSGLSHASKAAASARIVVVARSLGVATPMQCCWRAAMLAQASPSLRLGSCCLISCFQIIARCDYTSTAGQAGGGSFKRERTVSPRQNLPIGCAIQKHTVNGYPVAHSDILGPHFRLIIASRSTWRLQKHIPHKQGTYDMQLWGQDSTWKKWHQTHLYTLLRPRLGIGYDWRRIVWKVTGVKLSNDFFCFLAARSLWDTCANPSSLSATKSSDTLPVELEKIMPLFLVPA